MADPARMAKHKEIGMARAKKAKTTQDVANTLSDASADAAANMLRQAADAGNGTDSVTKAETIARLARMCEEAADHMARAQDVLFDGQDGGEAAIDHLDAALACLQTLASEGERHISEKTVQAQTG